jgi:UPF0042 nucleotide-binding protein
MLGSMRQMSNYVIDTSAMLVRELKEEIDRIFVNREENTGLIINIVSFGFKNGILIDADLIFDVRFLPNPYYIEDLKNKTGQDQAVRDYVMAQRGAGTFLNKLNEMVDFLIPHFTKEGKYQLIIGIGCTGGKHRSVTLANELFDRMKDKNYYLVKLSHRDIHRSNK